jgi:hypothetical protein
VGEIREVAMKHNGTLMLVSGTALILSVAASLWLAFWPAFYQGVSVSVRPNGEETVRTSASLVAVNGYRVVFLVLIPVVLTVVVFLAIARMDPRQLSGKIAIWAPLTVLLLFCVAGISSIGLFYIPAAVALLAAAIVVSRKRGTQPGRAEH